MHEFNELYECVRIEGIPVLMAGTATVSPIPLGIDISVGHSALHGAVPTTSYCRNSIKVQTCGTRDEEIEVVSDQDRERQLKEADLARELARLNSASITVRSWETLTSSD